MTKVKLDGNSLSTSQLTDNETATIEVDDSCLEQVRMAEDLLKKANKKMIPIYGLNVGVGLFQGKEPNLEAQNLNFNIHQAYATAAGDNLLLSESMCKRVLIIRLNEILAGKGGISIEVVSKIRELLDYKIYPCLPTSGSTGVGDIGLLSHITLALTGEGYCWQNGKKHSTSELFIKEKIEKVTLKGKDSLGMMSSNAFGKCMLVELVSMCRKSIAIIKPVFLFSLETYRGSPVPLLESLKRSHQKSNLIYNTERLESSGILDLKKSKNLQDPLSFRCFPESISILEKTIDEIEELVNFELNCCDENPQIIEVTNRNDKESLKPLNIEDSYYLVPTSHFNTLSWVLKVESLKNLLCSLSNMIFQRSQRHLDPNFSGKSRFYATENNNFGNGYLTRAMAEKYSAIKQISMPVLNESLAVEESVEDFGTNSTLACQNAMDILKELNGLLSYELLISLMAYNSRKGDVEDYCYSRTSVEIINSLVKVLDRLESTFYSPDIILEIQDYLKIRTINQTDQV